MLYVSRCRSSRMLEHKLIKDYLQINAFLDLVVMEQEEKPHALQKKAIERATSEVIKKTTG